MQPQRAQVAQVASPQQPQRPQQVTLPAITPNVYQSPRLPHMQNQNPPTPTSPRASPYYSPHTSSPKYNVPYPAPSPRVSSPSTVLPAGAPQTSSSFTGLIVMRTPEQVQQLERAMDNLVKSSVDLVSLVFENRSNIDQFERDLETTVYLFGEFQTLIVDDESKQKAANSLQSFQNLKHHIFSLLALWRPCTPFPEDIQSQIAKALFSLLNEHLLVFVELMDSTHIKRVLLVVKKSIEWLVDLRGTTNDYRFGEKFSRIQEDLQRLIRYCEERANYYSNPQIQYELRQLANTLRVNIPELKRTTEKKISEGAGSAGEFEQKEVIRVVATTVSRAGDIVKNNPLAGSASFEHLKMYRAFDHLEKALEAGSTPAATAAARAIIEEVKAIKQTAPQENHQLHQPLEALQALTADLLKGTKDALQGSEASKTAIGNIIAGLKEEVAKVDHYKAKPDVPYVALKDSGLMDAALDAAKKLSEMFQDEEW